MKNKVSEEWMDAGEALERMYLNPYEYFISFYCPFCGGHPLRLSIGQNELSLCSEQQKREVWRNALKRFLEYHKKNGTDITPKQFLNSMISNKK